MKEGMEKDRGGMSLLLPLLVTVTVVLMLEIG